MCDLAVEGIEPVITEQGTTLILNPSSATYYLCDLGQTTFPLYTSVFLPVNGDNKRTYLIELKIK